MRTLPCFLYREGEHFSLPPELRALAPYLCPFAVPDDQGRPRPHPDVFHETRNPDDAAVFLFPLAIGRFVDAGFSTAVENLIASLPFLPGRERRTILFDDGDSPQIPRIPLCLFKFSVSATAEEQAVPVWYDLPEYVLAASPSFAPEGIRYDVSFSGVYNNPLRRAAVLSIQKQAPELRLYARDNDSIRLRGKTFFNPSYSAETARKRRQTYLRVMERSQTVLCPPGIGLQSVRMYETMYLGRIPILFEGETVYPLRDRIRYEDFCFFIPRGEVMNTGLLLRGMLRAHTPESLREKCVLAHKTWNAHFSPQKKIPALLDAAGKKFGLWA